MNSITDMFTPDEKVTLKYSEFYTLLKEASLAETIKDLAMCEESPKKAGAIIKKLIEYQNGGKRE
jgi:hypothetical protein